VPDEPVAAPLELLEVEGPPVLPAPEFALPVEPMPEAEPAVEPALDPELAATVAPLPVPDPPPEQATRATATAVA
jgi:hypothetical protein